MLLICILPEFLDGLKFVPNPIIKDQMAGLGCLFVCTFGNFLAPVLITAHTANNLGFGDEQDHEDEGHEND